MRAVVRWRGVQGVLRPASVGFLDRVEAPRWWGAVSVAWPRWAVAGGLALVPPLVLLAAIWFGPEAVGRSATEPETVRGAFGRVLAGVLAASTIAVSVAVLALRGEMKDLREFADAQNANEELREELRKRLGLEEPSLALAAFAGEILDGIAARARELRRTAWESAGRVRMGVTLGDYLDTLARRAATVSTAVRERGSRPDRLHLAFLDMEHEVLAALARRFGRDEQLPAAVREGLRDLHDLMRSSEILQRYTKTLETVWGLSSMSQLILLASFPAIVLGALMTLLYGETASAALGVRGAGTLICAFLVVLLLPLAAFVSYLVRFLFLNQHTLAPYGMLLGPEEPDVIRAWEASGSPRRAS